MADTSAAAEIWDRINVRCLDLLTRAQRDGLLDADADLEWTRQVYYALMSEALQRFPEDQEPDAKTTDTLATLVVDTLLYGFSPRR